MITLDVKMFEKKIMNVAQYSVGFLDGIQGGKTIFLDNFGKGVIDVLKLYIDSEARTNPQALHHVYEWYQAGQQESRLFDIHKSVNKGGVSFTTTFSQSKTLSNNSNEPFYDKAAIMEEGRSITISPKNATALSFNIDGEQIFTRKSVTINHPGGDYTQGSFKDVMDQFFSSYFKQSFLKSSGLYEYLQKPDAYRHNMAIGALKGRVVGYETGFRWITGARIGVK